ncbi:MAG: hypothetical protein NTX52_02985 [Planctomycetota bacterium]|jgi:hypothetical protein|nr:hypothetical protein [Planctomycetota bacterium]
MANEIYVNYSSSNTLYAVVRNRGGNVWYVLGQAFESWGTNGHDAGDYDITLTDKGGARYVGDFPTVITNAGRYGVQVFLQAGANPADSDQLVASREIVWSGKGEVTAERLLGNKAIQNKSSGEIKYYDDDGQTIILTHTPSDGESDITRTPS